MMVSLKIKSVPEGKGTLEQRGRKLANARFPIQPKEEELYVQTQMAVEVYGQKAASVCVGYGLVGHYIFDADY